MEENNFIFSLTDVVANAPYTFKEPLNLEMRKGEQWIIFGANGSGKSSLVKIIGSTFILRQGQIRYNFFNHAGGNKVSDNMRFVTFHDQYGGNADASFYQLRWNQGLIGDEIPSVEKVLRDSWTEEGAMSIEELGISDLLTKKTIMLSSGEFRRFQIAKILLHRPRVLVIDNPFIGLDEHNRKQVAQFLNSLIRKGTMQLIMVMSRWPQDLPAITHVVEVVDGTIKKIPIAEYHPQPDTTAVGEKEKNHIEALMKRLPAPVHAVDGHFEQVLKLDKVSISYGQHTILKNLDWEVKRGEKWALQGQNGAGKSTLLSLVCADNPQSYACNITLFGHRRGTGESIWDIKRHIGYVSPEMFRTYRKPMPAKSIVASGLFDTIGLFRQPKAEDFERIDLWLDIFHISDLKEKNYMHLSDGEQRLVLLARAFVKDPGLLILDEPFHGLDNMNRRRAKTAIECFCTRPGKTMIMVSHYEEDFPGCISHYLKLQKH